MKKKEIKNLAKRIAEAEYTIQTSEDPIAIKTAQETIFKLSDHIKSMEDMATLDCYIQEILNQKI